MIGTSALSRRLAFTLVELMVAMAVATLLSATVLMALWSAQEEGRAARTRSQVTKLNEYIMSQWETYASAQIPIVYSGPNAMTPFSPTPREKLQARLVLLRDMMRMELPDRKTDVLLPKVTLSFRDSSGNIRGYATLAREPRAWREYQRRASAGWTEQFQGAECLYLIISTLRDDNSTALDYFRNTDVGDKDGDGMLEIWDGWSNPIEFLRWAPGFDSLIQIPNRNRSPDYFDPLHVDPRWANPNELIPFNLTPLIYSAGADQSYGLLTEPAHAYATTNPIPVDPYAPTPNGLIGQRDGTSDADDNITNHYLEVQ
jgi:prepilin-type N-terminal cleavage/methylation domain-containing protein